MRGPGRIADSQGEALQIPTHLAQHPSLHCRNSEHSALSAGESL